MQIPSFETLVVQPELDPRPYLLSLTQTPPSWVTEYLSSPAEASTATSTCLTTLVHLKDALRDQRWSWDAIGNADIDEVIRSGEPGIEFAHGVTDEREGGAFFVQVRSHHGLTNVPASVEFAFPFLCFFN